MRWVVFLLASVATCAADLDAIRQTQAKLFAMRGRNPEVRGANPELTVLKHQIRDWVESRIANFPANGDVESFSEELDSQLDSVKITKPDTSDDVMDLRLGEVDGVKLEHPKGDQSLLMFTSGVGVDRCGNDSSVYLYEWTNGGWTRQFELEHDDYAAGKYGPIESVGSVEVSKPDEFRNRLVLVLGNSWGCASMWQGVSYSLFRIGGTPMTLLDGSDTVYMGSDDESYQGRLEPHGLLVEHRGWSKDVGVLIRRHVLHYQVDGDSVRRVEPIALDPQDFVDEWLSDSWSEIKEWSESKLEKVHSTLEKAAVDGGFQLVQRCMDNASHWQIGFDFESGEYYFLVEQRGEHSFRMIDVTDERSSGCPGEGAPRTIENPLPSLFPPAKKPELF